MTRSLIAALVFAPLAIAACASSEAAPAQSTTTAQAASSTGDAQQLCVETFTRNRTCTDDYIPSLVDTRAKLDKPPGIAEAVKNDRNGVIAQAKAEWAEDSKDENIARTCQMLTEKLTDAQTPAMNQARACLAKQTCGDYVACIQPVFEGLMAQPH